MKYLVKMEVIKSSTRIEETKLKAKKKALSKYEIRYEEDTFFTNDLGIAKAIRGVIRGSSKRLEATIYQKIQGKYLPLYTHKAITNQEIEEILTLSTENKEGK